MMNFDYSQPVVSFGDSDTTLVFIHYFGGSAETWKGVIDILSTHFRCMALNLPGFGNIEIHERPSISYYADFIKKELSKLDIKKYILIGHSMGGKIAIQLAIKEQKANAVQQLILLAPSPPTIERMSDGEKQRMLQHPNETVSMETVNKIIRKKISLSQFDLAVYTQEIIDRNVWQWWLNEGMNQPIKENTKALSLPITVISSEDDPCITGKMIREDVIPNLPTHTRLIMTQGIGHLYPYEATDWLAACINEIIGDTCKLLQ